MATDKNKNDTAKKAGAIGFAAGVGAALAGPIGLAGAAAAALAVSKVKKKKK